MNNDSNSKTYGIPMEECEDGWTYLIDARNSIIGICGENGQSFTISRHKYKANFLYDEYHWDTGEPHGTVNPLKKIERAPEFKDDNEKLNYLNALVKEWSNKKESINQEMHSRCTNT